MRSLRQWAERDGEDLRIRPLLDRKVALAELLHGNDAGIVLNEHLAIEGAVVFEQAPLSLMVSIISPRSFF
jgi:hypothetical protein